MPPKMTDRMTDVEHRLDRLESNLDGLKDALIAEIKRAVASTAVSKEASQNIGVSAHSSLDEFRLSTKKVELPSLTGDDPVAWITRVETYFEVQNISEEVQIQLAKLSMDGPTIHWFNLWRDSTENHTWENLSEAMMARFGGGRLENPFEEFKELTQTGSVEDYVAEFDGRKPPVLMHFVEGETRVETVAQELRDRDEALRQLKYNLQRGQEQMKYQADKKRKEVQFELGDWIFLKLIIGNNLWFNGFIRSWLQGSLDLTK